MIFESEASEDSHQQPKKTPSPHQSPPRALEEQPLKLDMDQEAPKPEVVKEKQEQSDENEDDNNYSRERTPPQPQQEPQPPVDAQIEAPKSEEEHQNEHQPPADAQIEGPNSEEEQQQAQPEHQHQTLRHKQASLYHEPQQVQEQKQAQEQEQPAQQHEMKAQQTENSPEDRPRRPSPTLQQIRRRKRARRRQVEQKQANEFLKQPTIKIQNLSKSLKRAYEKGFLDDSKFDYIRSLRKIRKHPERDSVSSHYGSDQSFDIKEVLPRKGFMKRRYEQGGSSSSDSLEGPKAPRVTKKRVPKPKVPRAPKKPPQPKQTKAKVETKKQVNTEAKKENKPKVSKPVVSKPPTQTKPKQTPKPTIKPEPRSTMVPERPNKTSQPKQPQIQKFSQPKPIPKKQKDHQSSEHEQSQADKSSSQEKLIVLPKKDVPAPRVQKMQAEIDRKKAQMPVAPPLIVQKQEPIKKDDEYKQKQISDSSSSQGKSSNTSRSSSSVDSSSSESISKSDESSSLEKEKKRKKGKHRKSKYDTPSESLFTKVIKKQLLLKRQRNLKGLKEKAGKVAQIDLSSKPEQIKQKQKGEEKHQKEKKDRQKREPKEMQVEKPKNNEQKPEIKLNGNVKHKEIQNQPKETSKSEKEVTAVVKPRKQLSISKGPELKVKQVPQQNGITTKSAEMNGSTQQTSKKGLSLDNKVFVFQLGTINGQPKSDQSTNGISSVNQKPKKIRTVVEEQSSGESEQVYYERPKMRPKHQKVVRYRKVIVEDSQSEYSDQEPYIERRIIRRGRTPIVYDDIDSSEEATDYRIVNQKYMNRTYR